MYAVVNINGKQHTVKKEEILKINRLSFNPGEAFDIKEVLAVGENENIKFGAPYVDGAVVKAVLMENKKDKKVIVFKKKRRKRYEVKKGHRQPISLIKITEIIS